MAGGLSDLFASHRLIGCFLVVETWMLSLNRQWTTSKQVAERLKSRETDSLGQ